MMRLMTMLAILLISVACTASANSAQCVAAESKKQGHVLLQAKGKANAMSAHGMEAYPTLTPGQTRTKPCKTNVEEEYMSPPVSGQVPAADVMIIDVVEAETIWECVGRCMHSFSGGNGNCAGTMFNSSAQDLGLPSCTRYFPYYDESDQSGTGTGLLSVKGCVTAVSSTALWTQETGTKCGPCWKGDSSSCFTVESAESCQALAESYGHAFFQYQESAGKCATMTFCSEPNSNSAWSTYTSS